ncbi:MULTISPECIES: hypothetical protein [Methylobacterium]|uniref:Phage neck terminator protein gp12-like domain-containing protein n=2 Tax=Pseudomonadota TaxID=1224 RepID=A0ABQ4T359_9HYPH|nr:MULTISPECIES: hypothetical protein [Methylobacterium]PIU06913.1 MAG: hypothetical protein COT56_07210 [Methylobacterium sp. CG09_land_8_20_14_0_10_71_15]PIU16125.1 MAG: hypothetical protein COT28_01530 [Methylobacterium sp. CG08_land_8_20_14_0_20_71_15]GBU18027.1 hypothetical protein AwMethylo_22420 [Methylobacterium sp.]GJE08633.1 hypothetical protein AOPFMNJM_3976 [Methylobacterium jeotgali]
MATSANTSATGGYLAPTSPAPATDLDLDQVLQALVVGLTGLPGDWVRARWQPNDDLGEERPRIPSIGTTWCAVGVTDTMRDDQPAQIHRSAGDGSTILIAHETVTALASFYGPKGDGYASLMRDGLSIAQNREDLTRMGMALYDVDPVRRVPSIMNTRTRRRADLIFRLRRRVERIYPILNVLKGVGTVHADSGTIIETPVEAPET